MVTSKLTALEECIPLCPLNFYCKCKTAVNLKIPCECKTCITKMIISQNLQELEQWSRKETGVCLMTAAQWWEGWASE